MAAISSEVLLSPLESDVIMWTAIDNGRQIVFASFTLLLYEYLITLDKEVKWPSTE